MFFFSCEPEEWSTQKYAVPDAGPRAAARSGALGKGPKHKKTLHAFCSASRLDPSARGGWPKSEVGALEATTTTAPR